MSWAVDGQSRLWCLLALSLGAGWGTAAVGVRKKIYRIPTRGCCNLILIRRLARRIHPRLNEKEGAYKFRLFTGLTYN